MKPIQSAFPTPELPSISSFSSSLPQLGGQSGFRRVCTTDEPTACPIPGLAAGVLEMRVKEGSKIRNLLGFVMARMQREGQETRTGLRVRQVVFTGSGKGITKTITCVEILKRKLGGLHQLSKLHYKTVSEVWESQETDVTPRSRMTVHKTVPAISILLSKHPLDPREPGYQPPETLLDPSYQPPGHQPPRYQPPETLLDPSYQPPGHQPPRYQPPVTLCDSVKIPPRPRLEFRETQLLSIPLTQKSQTPFWFQSAGTSSSQEGSSDARSCTPHLYAASEKERKTTGGETLYSPCSYMLPGPEAKRTCMENHLFPSTPST
ncbi:uncharacterized protein ACWYII_045412 [Salvelinus alpinus]